MEPRLIFADLPAELRNIIYTSTITPSQPASHAGLPFISKTYTFSHTKVILTPIHHGNPSFLALRRFRFQEASEYHSYLLTNAIQLRISVLFNGHINTFVQEHWDKKIASHLKNLVKKYAWLANVLDYDIRIMWEPKIMVGKKRRNVGAIADRMVEVLTGMIDAGLKRKKGVLKVELQIGQGAACDYVRRQQPLGLADFAFFEQDAWQKHSREVRIAHEDFRTPKNAFLALSTHLEAALNESKEWECRREGHLFFKKEAQRKMGETVARLETITKPTDGAVMMTVLFPVLIKECTHVVDKRG